MSSLIQKTVQEAIERRKVISVFFFGEGGPRLLEPFCLGMTDSGMPGLRAYQVGGFSNTFTSFGWKVFKLDLMVSAEVTDQGFSGVRDGGNADEVVFDEIICEVECSSTKGVRS